MAGQMMELRSLLQAVKDDNERLSTSWQSASEVRNLIHIVMLYSTFSSVCVCVCVYGGVCVHVCAYVHVVVCGCVNAWMCACGRACVCVCDAVFPKISEAKGEGD